MAPVAEIMKEGQRFRNASNQLPGIRRANSVKCSNYIDIIFQVKVSVNISLNFNRIRFKCI